MTVVQLRPYQKESVDQLRDKFKKAIKVILLVITGGGGKTTIAGYMINEAQKKGVRVLFIAHRKELIKQAHKRIKTEFGIDAGVIMSGFEAEPHKLVQIASIQTLQRRELPPAGLIMVDEGHRAVADEYIKILKEYEMGGSYIVGLTGTPFSANKRRGLNELYHDYVANIKCSELLEIGAVVPIKAYGSGRVSSKGMKSRGGEFREDELLKAFDTENVYVNLISNFERLAKDKKTIVFCCSVAHSIKVTQEFLNHGYKAMHIDGNTPSKERDKAVEYFRSGEIQVLVNCSIACEGLDVPNCEAEIMAVNTKSKTKYFQCVWRIMRPFPGKTHGIFIDMGDNYERFAAMDMFPDGDIEVSLEPETKDEGSGVSPVKICPSCSFMNHASFKCCADCNHEFKKTKKEIEEEEFVELQREKKERAWKNYSQKDWYKIKDEDLEAFGKLKNYSSKWHKVQLQLRKENKKPIKIKDFPAGTKDYYKEVRRLEDLYYNKKPIDATEFVFLEENKSFVVFQCVSKKQEEEFNAGN